jgi:hypothetical protein
MKFDEIKNEDLDSIDLMSLSDRIKSDEYKKYFLSRSGMEHYRLLSFISQTNNNSQFLDVGTLKGCSALALSINPSNKVFSFDLSNSFDLSEIPENTEFIIDNILQEKYKDIILSSNYILLDTFHDGTFELEFLNYLSNIKYMGILLLDDIYLNSEMSLFWDEIQFNKKDLTYLGHSTGTGVVFFE